MPDESDEQSRPLKTWRESASSTGYFCVHEINGIEDLREAFREGADYTMNWLFASTSSLYGPSSDLNEIERWFADPRGKAEESGLDPDDPEPETHQLAILIVKPRIVQVVFGVIDVRREDIPWLREVLNLSLKGIAETQRENLPASRL